VNSSNFVSSTKAIKEEIKENPMKKRDSKEMRSPSPSYSEAWKRVQGANSRPATPTSGLPKEFSDDNISEYSNGHPYEHIPLGIAMESQPQMMKADNSLISGFDSMKDNLSVNSNPVTSAFQNTQFQTPLFDKPTEMNCSNGELQQNKFDHFMSENAQFN
jgi:hypothetical protein